MAVGSVLEEIVNPFLFHQPAGELKIRLPILHAVVARMKNADRFEHDMQAVQHFFQDVGDGEVLNIRHWTRLVSSQNWGTISIR